MTASMLYSGRCTEFFFGILLLRPIAATSATSATSATTSKHLHSLAYDT